MVFDVTVTHDAQKSIRTTPLALVTLEFLRQLPRLTFNKSNFENPPLRGTSCSGAGVLTDHPQAISVRGILASFAFA